MSTFNTIVDAAFIIGLLALLSPVLFIAWAVVKSWFSKDRGY